MNDASSLTNQFLIAMPAMQATNASPSVIDVCEYNHKAAPTSPSASYSTH